MTPSAHTTTDEPIVVIGSGPSGAVAAHQLVERGCDVVLLDSGLHAPKGVVVRAAGNTLFRKMGSRDMTDDRLAAGSSASTVWHSSLSHGGLSNFWTSAVPRFHPEDFTDGARLDERYRWPVTYDELVPYYEQAERHLRVTADEPIDGVPPNVLRHQQQLPPDWRALVHRIQEQGDGAGAIPLAKGEPWMVALRGTEFSSYHCVVRPLVSAGRLRLFPGAHVLRLVWSAPAGRVTAVEYADRATRTIHQIRVRGVVLAAGTIDSTMILLRSTSSDFPDGLGNSHDLVGRYLHDHPREWWPATLARPMRALAHPVYLARRPHDVSDPLLSTSHTIGLSAPKQRLRTYVRGSTSTIGVQVFGTMVPKPERGVEIDRDAPGSADQRPVITLRYDNAEVANIHSSRERLAAVMSRAGTGLTVSGPFHDLQPGSSVHMAGTIRMHGDPQFGVLDRYTRVHDAPDVVVCDMSAFTTGPEKNPTLTAMALAIRAADRLADDLA
jgi:choline dehydrogenase-like flavoprotein